VRVHIALWEGAAALYVLPETDTEEQLIVSLGAGKLFAKVMPDNLQLKDMPKDGPVPDKYLVVKRGTDEKKEQS